MLTRMRQKLIPQETSRAAHIESLFARDEKEDMKTAIEYLYEFQEKMSQLHPAAMEVMNEMLQRPRC